MYKMRQFQLDNKLDKNFIRGVIRKILSRNLTHIVDNTIGLGRSHMNTLTPWPHKFHFYIEEKRGQGEDVIINYENYEYAYLPIAH
jgi:hypothetical protein